MQALPVDTQILETLAPLLVAPFSGRLDKHAGTVDAFDEFWQAAYAGLPAPPCGYPEQIVQCLNVVAKARLEEQEDEALVEDMTAVLDGEVESPILEQLARTEDALGRVEDEEAVESEDEGSVVVPSPRTLAAMSGPVPMPTSPVPVAFFDAAHPIAPSTPRTSPHRRPYSHSTPSRSYNVAPCPIASSAMDVSPIRAPTTPKRSPAKSHAAKNKENHSPLLHIPTVTERLAARSPLLLESILGKRPRNEDAEDLAALDEKAPKISRLDASPLARLTVNSVQIHAVMHDSSDAEVLKELPAADDVAKPVQDDREPSAQDDVSLVASLPPSPTPISRKRKGVFLDAVEVPAVETIIRARRRLSMTPLTEENHASTSSLSAPHPPLRRTRSATKLFDTGFQKLVTPKRRRVGRAEELRGEAADLSSPLRSLRDSQMFGSGE